MTRKPRLPVLNAPTGLRQRERADGTWRVWWEPRTDARRAGFQPVDLPADRPDHARREAARLNAEVARVLAAGTTRGAARPGGRTIEDLIRAYRASPHFTATLAPKTRDSYGKLLLQVQDKWGHRRAADFDKPVMAEWYAALHAARGTRMAQALIRMMSILFSHAEVIGWRPEGSNPCIRLRLVTPQGRGRVVTWAEYDALVTAADAMGRHALALALAMALFTGQRETDILQATRGAFGPVTGGTASGTWVWWLARSKRGNTGALPIHADLLPALRRALADAGTAAAPRGPGDALLVDEVTGRPYDEHLFAKRYAAARVAAAKALPSVASVQFRDLRRSFGVFARAGGATVDDAGDVLGNSVATNPTLQETYLPRSFFTAQRAVDAIRRPAQAQPGKETG
jgi:hypothetical protein